MKIVSKILFLFLFFNLFFTSIGQASSKYIGKGEVKLSYKVVGHFKEYIRNNQKKPSIFLITTDGQGSYYIYCPYSACQPPRKKQRIDECEKYYPGKECAVFAMRRTVKWKNGINTGLAKQSKFKHTLSNTEIQAKLTELGFLGNTTSSSDTTKKKETKPKITKKDGNTLEQLKEIKKMLDEGLISEAEFKKLKKEILD